MLIVRKKSIDSIIHLLKLFPVVALIGPRQCGKTTLAKQFSFDYFFDLENPRDLARFDNPQLTLEKLEGIIIIDEIQRKPELFPLLRHIVDQDSKKKFLILGSASREMLKQSSESLAGRIGYFELAGFDLTETENSLENLWLKGGLPRAYLAESPEDSFLWLEQYISTFLERDIPQLGINIPARTMKRFWTMLAHYHGQVINYSEFGASFGISDVTVRKYFEILEGTFMARSLQPYFANVSKRIVKRPKIYIRDSGIFHSLSGITSSEILFSHNKLGASFEGFAIEELIKISGLKSDSFFFYGTHGGAELDLFWQKRGKNFGAEIKYQDAPKITKSMKQVIVDLSLSHLWVIYPGKEEYQLEKYITVLPITSTTAVFS